MYAAPNAHDCVHDTPLENSVEKVAFTGVTVEQPFSPAHVLLVVPAVKVYSVDELMGARMHPAPEMYTAGENTCTDTNEVDTVAATGNT